MGEGRPGISLCELFDEEVTHYHAVSHTCVKRIVVLEIQIIDSNVALRSGSQDCNDSRKLVCLGCCCEKWHEIHGAAHAGVVVHRHLAVDSFSSLVAAAESHEAGSEEETINLGFFLQQFITKLIAITQQTDVFLYEDCLAVRVEGV